MAKSMTKPQLVAELAEASGEDARLISTFLDKLAEISYREAANGFVIPGICKLSVVNRKGRRFRNPATGQLLQISDRQALKIVALKKCRELAAPTPANIVTVVPESEDTGPKSARQPPTAIPPLPSPPPPPPAATAAPSLPPPPAEDVGNIVFSCPHCGNTVSALPETANMAGECPFCGDEILIPSSSLPPSTPAAKPAEHDAKSACGITGFITFICTACNQEIEAPMDMIGLEASCPTCGSPIHVPREDEKPVAPPPRPKSCDPEAPKPDMRSMTIRIDLSDLT